MEAKVIKVSETGKTMMVGIKTNPFQIGYTFGWCANPEGKYKKDDIIADMPKPSGQVQAIDEKGEPVVHTDGSPVMRWVF